MTRHDHNVRAVVCFCQQLALSMLVELLHPVARQSKALDYPTSL